MTAETQPRLRLLAGLSLQQAIRAYCTTLADPQQTPDVEFGASQELAQRIESGDNADLFLTCDITHALAVAPDSGRVQTIARDTLIAVTRPEIGIGEGNFLDRLLDPRVRIGIGKPGVHTGADAAVQMFARAEAARPGAYDTLRSKVKIVLGENDLSTQARGPRRIMEMLGSGEVDVFLGMRAAQRTLSAVAELVSPPGELSVVMISAAADMTRTPPRAAMAAAFMEGLVSSAGQAMLARHGFLTTQSGGIRAA